jgi:hypothetical protein
MLNAPRGFALVFAGLYLWLIVATYVDITAPVKPAVYHDAWLSCWLLGQCHPM